MMIEVMRWSLRELPLYVFTAITAHLVMSGGQTLFHCSLGHRRLGGVFHRNHIRFHHRYYARGSLVSPTPPSDEGNNTPYFLIPTVLVAGAAFYLLPFGLFLVAVAASAASFYAHVYLDREYHAEQPKLGRFAWFRRKQQLHFVHHLHADANFAVIDFFWDRLLGTYRRPDGDAD
jgi:sterol desaturase/sphingolipid hydroxylase (fatty acid hydroxylase superfamily)